MQAAELAGGGVVRVVSRTDPEPTADEVRVRVAFCAACGSDNRLVREGSPVVPGHEITGTVEAVGPAVSPSLIGTRVAVYIPLFCGTCAHCRAGRTNICPNITGLVGWQRDGGYATYVAVPARNLIALPDDVGLDEAVLLLDTLGTTGHAVRQATRIVSDPAAPILILGFGPLGVGATLSLLAEGYKDVSVIDPAPLRQRLATHLGATLVTADDVGERPTYALVVEASGRLDARRTALYGVAPGGVVLLLGENDQPWTITPSKALRRKDFFTLRTFYFPVHEVPLWIEHLRSVRARLSPLLETHRPLSTLPDTLAAFMHGELLKPLSYPDA